VKPWELLGQTRAPDGADLSLTLRSGEYVILANGKSLMSSRMHGSEEALATFGCARIRDREAPRVLVGGLGMGFTLRATLDHLPDAAAVVVAELIPAVVEWNREILGPLAQHPLKDRRVRVEVQDVAITLRSASARFDAVLLDVDNGPEWTVTVDNAALYRDQGLSAVDRRLAPGGRLAVWSAHRSADFEGRLRARYRTVETREIPVARGEPDVIWVACGPRLKPPRP